MKKGVSTDTLFLILNAKYSIMNKKSTALANAFDEAIQVKTQAQAQQILLRWKRIGTTTNYFSIQKQLYMRPLQYQYY